MTLLQRDKRLVGLTERKALHFGLDRNSAGQFQQFFGPAVYRGGSEGKQRDPLLQDTGLAGEQIPRGLLT